jgi:hypothetical protein
MENDTQTNSLPSFWRSPWSRTSIDDPNPFAVILA